MPRIELLIPNAEAATVPDLLDAIRVRLEQRIPELDHDMFIIGPNNGISFRVVHPVGGIPVNTTLVHVDYEERFPNPQ